MLTPEKLQRERAVFSAFIYDLLLVGPYLWIAIEVGSLTILGEVMRGMLMITVTILSWMTLRKIHRGQTGDYDFGMGKVEQILSLSVAVMLTASVVYIWVRLLSSSPAETQEVDAMSYVAVGLAFANLSVNLALLHPLYQAMKTGKSVLVTAQFRAKIAKSIGSLVVTLCVALNQLTSSMALALWAERVGVLIVTLVTLHAAYELIKSSLPDLLDRTLPEELRENQPGPRAELQQLRCTQMVPEPPVGLQHRGASGPGLRRRPRLCRCGPHHQGRGHRHGGRDPRKPRHRHPRHG